MATLFFVVAFFQFLCSYRIKFAAASFVVLLACLRAFVVCTFLFYLLAIFICLLFCLLSVFCLFAVSLLIVCCCLVCFVCFCSFCLVYYYHYYYFVLMCFVSCRVTCFTFIACVLGFNLGTMIYLHVILHHGIPS